MLKVEISEAMLADSSLVSVEHLDGGHESTDTDAIILRIANFLRLIVNRVEFADFVAVTDGFEQ